MRSSNNEWHTMCHPCLGKLITLPHAKYQCYNKWHPRQPDKWFKSLVTPKTHCWSIPYFLVIIPWILKYVWITMAVNTFLRTDTQDGRSPLMTIIMSTLHMYNDICVLYVYMNENTIKFLCMYWKLSLIVTWLVCISGYYVPLSIDDRFCLLQSLPKIQ